MHATYHPVPPPAYRTPMPRRATLAASPSAWTTLVWVAGGLMAVAAAGMAMLFAGVVLLVLVAAAASTPADNHLTDGAGNSQGDSFEDEMSGFMAGAGGSYDSSSGSISY
jgi:hypothetical protein